MIISIIYITLHTYFKLGGIRVGSERWGLRIIEVENFSNKTNAVNAVETLIEEPWYNATFFFGPITSGLLGPTAAITEAHKKLMISSRSNFPSVWTLDAFNYTLGMMYQYPAQNWVADVFPLYAANGAKTVGYICDLKLDFDTLTYCHEKASDLIAQLPASMTLTRYLQVDSTKASYRMDLYNVVLNISLSDVDVIIVSADAEGPLYDDAIGFMKDLNFNPKGFVCECDPEATSSDPTDYQYFTFITDWSEQQNYTSGISGEQSEHYPMELKDIVTNYSFEYFFPNQALATSNFTTNSQSSTTKFLKVLPMKLSLAVKF